MNEMNETPENNNLANPFVENAEKNTEKTDGEKNPFLDSSASSSHSVAVAEKSAEISETEKMQLLQTIEPQKPKAKPAIPKKSISATGIFAGIFSFFLFIIVLLIFVLSISGDTNPIFQSFGVEAFEIKDFLKTLANKTFFVMTLLLLLLFAIGIFRGYSLPKEKTLERRGSFGFGAVSGGLIFVVILAWVGSLSFIEKFAVAALPLDIEIVNLDVSEEIVAPVVLEFSSENIAKSLRKQGFEIDGFRWSKDGGKTFDQMILDEKISYLFKKQGKQSVMVEAVLKSGETRQYVFEFIIDKSSFEVKPDKVFVDEKISLDAKGLVENAKKYSWDLDDDGTFETEKFSSSLQTVFDTDGKKTVNLRVETASAAIYDFSRVITVFAAKGKSIQAMIEPDREPKGKSPLEINFSAGGSVSENGEIVSYIWKIEGEKEEKKGESISYVFGKAGKFSVILEIENKKGEKSTQELEVEVEEGNTAPQAIIQTKPSVSGKSFLEGKAPFEVVFNANASKDAEKNIVKYLWKIGEEGSEEEFSGSEVSYSFRKSGEYPVILAVEDAEGEKSEAKFLVRVKAASIEGKILADNENGTVPLVVEFDASTSVCKLEDCKILAFEWNFGDGSPAQQTGAHVSHEFTKVGTYAVTAKIITNVGETETVTKNIAVILPPLVACFEPSRTRGTTDDIFIFDPSSCSKGEIQEYKWDFGDGTVSNKRKPSHEFPKSGKFIVTLQVFDADGRVSKTTIDVEIVE